MQVSEFNLDEQSGKVYVEYDNGTGVERDLAHAITGKLNTATGVVTLDDASRAAVQAVRVVSLPARAQALIPGVPVIISGGRAQLGCDPVTLVPMDPRAGATQYYVDVVNGVDTNNGSTWALAFKSIYKATQAGNAAAVPYTVNIAAGWYPRANGFSNNGATIHDAGVMLDLNGRYFKNYGGDYAHANASTIAVGVCTQTYGSYGDLDRPSGITRPGSGFVALSGSTIYKYDCVGADQVDGGGSILTA